MKKNMRWSMAGLLLAVFGLAVTPSFGQAPTATSTSSTQPKRHRSKKAADGDASPAPAGTTPAPATPATPSTEPAQPPQPATPAKPAKAHSEPATNASPADISAAQASGKVWVNTESGVYHKTGRYYGHTKQGKFMTEDDAKKAGYHVAKGEIGNKKS